MPMLIGMLMMLGLLGMVWEAPSQLCLHVCASLTTIWRTTIGDVWGSKRSSGVQVFGCRCMFCSVPCCSVYLSPMVALMTNISMNCRTTQSSPRYNHSPRLKKVYWHIAKRWKRDIKRAINGRRKTLSEDVCWAITIEWSKVIVHEF